LASGEYLFEWDKPVGNQQPAGEEDPIRATDEWAIREEILLVLYSFKNTIQLTLKINIFQRW
jgi:hypothetical protein